MKLSDCFDRKWIVSILGMYACGLLYIQRAGMAVAIVRMTDTNQTNIDNNAPRFNWNETLQGVILGAVFYLYWIVPTIVGSFTNVWGGKWPAFIGLASVCLLTMSIPISANYSAILIAIQTIIGGLQGFIYPSLFYLYVQWFEPSERSKANSGIQIGQSIGSCLIYIIGGYLCNTTIGWPLVFYTVALVHLPWIILWYFFVADYPPDKLNLKPNKQINTPWYHIATSPAVWASILSKLACSFGFYMFLSKLPNYLNKVHKVDIVHNGYINAATFASYGFSCFLAPFLADYIINSMKISTIRVRILFQGIAMLTPAICLLIITLIHDQMIIIIMIITAMFGYGFVTGGEWTLVSDYSPNFVGSVSGFIHILGFIAGFLAPYIVGIILDSDLGNLEFKWNISFYISAILYAICYAIFCFTATDQQQHWDQKYFMKN